MTDERRTQAHASEDEFSAEYLAVLVVCGGQVRDSDWALLPQSLAARRLPAPAEATDDEPGRSAS